MEEQPSEIGGPAPPPKQSGSVIFYMLGGNITTRHWKKFIFVGVLLYVVVYSQSELWMEEAVYDEKYSQDLDDCWSGETTPGELGLTGMTCEELEQDFRIKLIFSFTAACGACCFPFLGLMGLANAALFFQGETSVELVAAQQERERLRAEMGEVHSNLVEAVRVHQEVLDSKQRAEADYRQAVEEHSALINAISQAQEGMSSELEAAAARAERNIEAARVALTRYMKRTGKVWTRIFPNIPVSKKPTEVRMGKGKGSPEYWVCRVKPGRIIFEIDGVSESVAREALYKASTKLPIKTKFVKRY